ncbi:hypothetical protein EXIGLDRAFT_663068 [Exidia glandulosa HHB12029]|uniref:Pre-rRNA-processing protein RIX1 n=1 Tax=Exidia glandulosa HHB12029 TaxID=1314781 RepID=A0A165QLH0_EXIGL|nr:hypothetical protein EXIGLDRAFT_663068 [Exidia glandulosa HHB12029]
MSSEFALDPLEHVLQVLLANDNAAVQHLPTVLTSLSSPDYARSQHLRKFCTRVNALIHAKEPAPRWAGILIAEHAFRLNKDAVLDSAQAWVTAVLPLLSRKEPAALWKAAIALLDTVFVTTANLAEFQRQVTNPNASKFGLALLALADKGDEELQIVVFTSLARLVAVFPTLVRPLHAQASALSLRFLQGRYPSQQPSALVSAAAQLHSVLHLTGGKVGGANLWKKSVDDALLAANAHVAELRSTFEDGQRRDAASSDPTVAIPHALDALRGTVALICHLLRSPSSRPLPVPIGSIVQLCRRLLQSTAEESLENAFEKSRRAMEAAAAPELWRLGCDLLSQTGPSIGRHLSGYLSQLLPLLVAHLERPAPLAQKTPVLKAFICLAEHCYPPDEPILLSRATKSLLPHLARLIAPRAAPSTTAQDKGQGQGKKRKTYEGGELFNVGSDVVFSSVAEGDASLLVLECMQWLLRNPSLPAHLHSLTGRLVLSLSLELTGIDASRLSVDDSLHARLVRKVGELGVELSCGRATMGRAVGVVVQTTGGSGGHASRQLDLLLRPRVPPIPRSKATLDSDVLVASDKAQEQAVASFIGLGGPAQTRTQVNGGDEMIVDAPASTPPFEPRVAPMPMTKAAPAPPPTTSAVVTAVDLSAPKTTLPVKESNIAPVWGAAFDVVKGAVAPAKPEVAKVAATPRPAGNASDDDDDEEMPTINMQSDSDDE